MKVSLNPELTNHCNYRCKFCPQSYYKKKSPLGNVYDRKKGFMSKDLWKIVLRNAEKYAKVLCLGFFGEPMLHSHFKTFVDMVPEKRNYKFELNTNFSLVSSKYFRTLGKFDNIKVSLDSDDPLTYRLLCKGPKELGAIEDVLKVWLNLKGHSPTRIVHVVSSVNEKYVSRFIKKWKPLLGKEDHILTKSVLSYGGVIKDSYMVENRCKSLDQNWFIVGWNGVCSICNLDVNLELNVGTLSNKSTVEQILNSEQCQNVRRDIKSKLGICKNCFDANNWTKNKVYRKEN